MSVYSVIVTYATEGEHPGKIRELILNAINDAGIIAHVSKPAEVAPIETVLAALDEE